MAVKIVIKRNVPEIREKELIPLLIQMRNLCINQRGYISGETLKNLDKPGEYMVISTWQSVEDWKKWASSSQRIEIQSQIDYLLGQETEYGLYSNP
jgi:heme-degrading monooxygenase HmoA